MPEWVEASNTRLPRTKEDIKSPCYKTANSFLGREAWVMIHASNMRDIQHFHSSLCLSQQGNLVTPIGLDTEYVHEHLCVIQVAFIDQNTNIGYVCVMPLVYLETYASLCKRTIPQPLVDCLRYKTLLFFGNGIADDLSRLANTQVRWDPEHECLTQGFTTPDSVDLAKLVRYTGRRYYDCQLYELGRDVLRLNLDSAAKTKFQKSDWSQAQLSFEALTYAGLDAILSLEIAEKAFAGQVDIRTKPLIVATKKEETEKGPDEIKAITEKLAKFYAEKTPGHTQPPKGVNAKMNYIRNSFTGAESEQLRKDIKMLKAVAKKWEAM
jgi:hypothetical protein